MGEYHLTKVDRIELLRIARQAIVNFVHGSKTSVVDENTLSSNLLVSAGAFVTLKEYGKLRGCIGSFNPEKPLYKVVQSMAIASATEDYRFTPVKLSDIPNLEIEISVLTPMKLIKSIDEIILGSHGIFLKKGVCSGTLLPQVATETGWTLDEFLGHCAQDKASIGWYGWKDAEIYTYEAIVFEEKEFNNELK